MVKQHELRPPPGAKHREKRVGRGIGSGHGVYSTKGVKGQKARTGGKNEMRPGFEGGQLPLVKRLPTKRGFHNPFRAEYAEVNVGRLEATFSAGAEVTVEKLKEARIVKNLKKPVKVLGEGDLTKALTIKVHRFTASARQKIEAAGGQAIEVAS
ncbi:MAG: 50S ribosomal protein L15 [Chloroflexi bacterium]|nr:50S ribosomal protein L15 [Chloroflexota bacterium]